MGSSHSNPDRYQQFERDICSQNILKIRLDNSEIENIRKKLNTDDKYPKEFINQVKLVRILCDGNTGGKGLREKLAQLREITASDDDGGSYRFFFNIIKRRAPAIVDIYNEIQRYHIRATQNNFYSYTPLSEDDIDTLRIVFRKCSSMDYPSVYHIYKYYYNKPQERMNALEFEKLEDRVKDGTASDKEKAILENAQELWEENTVEYLKALVKFELYLPPDSVHTKRHGQDE